MADLAETRLVNEVNGNGHSDAGASRTNWEELQDAVNPTSSSQVRSLEAVARRYWPVVYAFIRHSGCNEEDARDLTQGFLADVVLGRGLLSVASPSRGRFRALLMHAVGNYLKDAHRRRTSAARHPRAALVPLDGPAPVADGALDPEVAFSLAWVGLLIREAAERFHRECERLHRHAWWIAFDRRVLRPALEGAAPPTLEELQPETGFASTAQMAHALACARRRFAKILLDVTGTASGGTERAREEVAELMTLMERGRP